MRAQTARELFREITQSYFDSGTVIFSFQSRVEKKDVPLVVLTPGPVRRPYMPNDMIVNGVVVGCYESKFNVTIDLFTHGLAVIDPDSRKIVGYENSAMNDMLAFCDYLNSRYVTNWLSLNDAAVLVDGDVQDVSGVINETNYEYRSRINVSLNFTEKAVGYAGVADEESIKYPTDEGWTDKPPVETESPTNGYVTDAMKAEQNAKVEPEFTQTSSGGGTDTLATEEGGYFTAAEIVEIKEEDS